MAKRGGRSKSFLRETELIGFSEIFFDQEGNSIVNQGILASALNRNDHGKLIRNKVNIAKIMTKYSIDYRMVFNAMNMEYFSKEDVKDAIQHLSDYISDIGVSGIVEFHASDKTQNSDHVHFWINSEDPIVYHKIATEMVAMGYSNKEDVYIQKYETNEKIDESEYVQEEDTSSKERFAIETFGEESTKLFHDIKETLHTEESPILEPEKKIASSGISFDEITKKALAKINTLFANFKTLKIKDKIMQKKEDESEYVQEEDTSSKERFLLEDTLEDKEFWDQFGKESDSEFNKYLANVNDEKVPVLSDCSLDMDAEIEEALVKVNNTRKNVNRQR